MNETTSQTDSGKRYYIETYGCQMNEYDSSLVAGILEERGYEKSDLAEDADLILVNTCSVREKAEDTALQKLDSIAHLKRKRPGTRLGVIGCMAENRREQILARIPQVDLLLGPDHYDKLGSALDAGAPRRGATTGLGVDRNQTYEGFFPAAPSTVSAFVAIQRGCDKKCTYCIVPFTRGPERSRPSHDILEETRRLVDKGVVEINLLGQTVNSWRSDISFAQLLRELGRIDGVRRIRFTSPHPRHFTESVCLAMAETPAVCPHVHMPVQSGSSRVLRAMRRQYGRDQYLAIVERLRRHIPDVAITTDIIAGYPGETREEHLETLSLMEEVRFDSAFMFAYSARPGTPAALEPETISPQEKLARLQEIIELQQSHSAQRLSEQVGRIEEVLLEGSSRRDEREWIGKTPHFRKVLLHPGPEARPGTILPVRLLARRGTVLRGEVA
ncbi:MAG: tRNA (N6-isopentenyl adenosine(37)-C2)-methylthiotransferase MiaB [Fibrobacteria bacterium]|nr:tRNA (N6-isopentenyl adenosine(37)-C2)-methylthiotransferase MiaB [Fibrobacteria bacterium]